MPKNGPPRFNVPIVVFRDNESGSQRIDMKAAMWPDNISVPVDADIEQGDRIERKLPNGKIQTYWVTAVNVMQSPFHRGNGWNLDHTEVKYTSSPPIHELNAAEQDVSNLNSVSPHIFKKIDLPYLSAAIASGLVQDEINQVELGLAFTTEGSKTKRAAEIVRRVFDEDPDCDATFLRLLNYTYFETSGISNARQLIEYKRLMIDVLTPRGVQLTDDGFQVGSASREASEEQAEGEMKAVVNSFENNKVFIVQGRDQRPVQVLETFLHFAGLEVLSWADAVDLTGKPTPSTYDVIQNAMNAAAVILVVFSPDDEARLKPEFTSHGSAEDLTGQPRQNVLLEAGMAFAMAPDRTIFVKSGPTREISDIAGFNWVTMDGTWDSRDSLIRRLRAAEAPIKLRSNNLTHHLAGEFKVS